MLLPAAGRSGIIRADSSDHWNLHDLCFYTSFQALADSSWRIDDLLRLQAVPLLKIPLFRQSYKLKTEKKNLQYCRFLSNMIR